MSRAQWLARFYPSWIDDESGREIGHTIPAHYHWALAHSYIVGEPVAIEPYAVGPDGQPFLDPAADRVARGPIVRMQVVRILDGTPDPLESIR